MAPKRRAEDEALPPNKERRGGIDRPEQLETTLSALNGQFASWASSNNDRYLHLLWVEGVRDYVRQATELLDEYKDALPAEGAAALQQISADALAQASRKDGPSTAATAPGAGKKDERAAEFVRDIADLNRQFARWVASNQESHPRLWWLEAARDYLTHATQLLADYSDLFPPNRSAGAGGATAAGAGGSGEGAATKAPTQPTAAFGGGSTPPETAATGGFGAFGAPGGSATGAGGGLFGALAPPQRDADAEARGAAPATGFMAAAAPSSAAASGSLLFGSLAPSTATGTAPSTTAGTFGFSFGAPAAAAAAASTPASAEATASDKGKDAAAPAAPAPKPFTFLTTSGAAEAATAAAESAAAAAPAAATTAATDAAAAAPAAPASGTGLFKFGAPPASSAAGGAPPVTTGFGVVSSDSAPAPKAAFTFGAPAASGASGSAAAGGSTAASSAATAPSFTFGAAAAAGGLAGSIFGGATGSTAPAFSFGAPPPPATTTTTGADAAKKDDGAASAAASGGGTASVPTSGFFFGAAAAPAGGAAAAPGAGFNFGGGGAAGSSAPAFGFGAPRPAAAAADGEGEDDEAEAETDECAKEPSLKVDDNVDFLFREKARLQVPSKDPEGKLKWEAKGLGTLSVRRARTEGAKPYMALFTDAGRCLFQAYIYKTMKVVVSDKQKSVALTAVWSPDGTSPPAMNHALFQLAGAKNRAFEEVVLKLQEEME